MSEISIIAMGGFEMKDSFRMPVIPKGNEWLFAFPETPATIDEYFRACKYYSRGFLFSRRTGIEFSNQAALVVLGLSEK